MLTSILNFPIVSTLSTFTNRLSGSAPSQIEDLKKNLAELCSAAESSESNDYEAFRAIAQKVEQEIEALTGKPSQETFKNSSRFSSWETYLQPLTNLKLELEEFRTCGIDGYNSDNPNLKDHLKRAVNFMNGEIKAHTGALNKVFTTVAQEAKKVVQQQVSGILGSSDQDLRIEPKCSPLQTLVYDVQKFRTNRKNYLDRFVSETLLNDLKTLELYHPLFKGVERYVLDRLSEEEETLLKYLDTFLVAFILKNVVPEIDAPDLYLAYYQAGLKFKHVAEDWENVEPEKQRQWGKECLEEEIATPKEKGTLFAAVAFMLEIGHFGELESYASTPQDSSKTLLKKVEKVIALIEKHPTIMMHREFKTQIKALIGGYTTAGYQLDPSSLERFQEAHKANQAHNFPQALLMLKQVLAAPSQTRPREVSMISQGLDALKKQASQYGIPLPKEIMGPVESVAERIDSQVESLMGSAREEERLPPLMQLEQDLRTFTAEREERNEQAINKALDKDLRGLEIAYPELKGIRTFVEEKKAKRHSLHRYHRTFNLSLYFRKNQDFIF